MGELEALLMLSASRVYSGAAKYISFFSSEKNLIAD